jgi:hypothetical protein
MISAACLFFSSSSPAPCFLGLSATVAISLLISSVSEAIHTLFHTMMMKSIFLLFATFMCASGFVAPAQRTARPFIVADSSARFLHPEQAKDLEEFAHKLMQEASQRYNTADTEKTSIQAHDCKQRNGPVAWCRRVVQIWKHA